MKKIIVAAALFCGALLLGGCSFSGGGNSNNTPTQNYAAPTTTNPQTQTADKSVGASEINIQNFAFTPGTLTIKKGTTVTWTNNDAAPHQIKSATFNSQVLSKGQSFLFTFNQVGSFDYSCAIHPMMTGKIIVQ